MLDDSSKVRQAWGLQEESSAIIVLDKEGKVRFVKDGALTQADVSQVMALIASLL